MVCVWTPVARCACKDTFVVDLFSSNMQWHPSEILLLWVTRTLTNSDSLESTRVGIEDDNFPSTCSQWNFHERSDASNKWAYYLLRLWLSKYRLRWYLTYWSSDILGDPKAGRTFLRSDFRWSSPVDKAERSRWNTCGALMRVGFSGMEVI